MSFAKIKAIGEDGQPMKNVFVLESAKREGFLIVVNCDDLGQNLIKNGGELKESMNGEYGASGASTGSFHSRHRASANRRFMRKDKNSKPNLKFTKFMIVKSKITLNYYGSSTDQEFFDLIYQSFEQKVKNFVIQKCGVVLNRS
jgi:hypothetical protein